MFLSRADGCEGKHDVAVIDFAPVIEILKRGLENSDDLPVDIVHRRGEEQQRADGPAKVTGGCAVGQPSFQRSAQRRFGPDR